MEHTEEEVYADGKKFASKDEQWQAITASAGSITPAEIKNLSSCIDTQQTIPDAISKKGTNIEYI